MQDPDKDDVDHARRKLLTAIAAASVGTAGFSACGSSSGMASDDDVVLPEPEDSGIDHIVAVMMENRSFDHYFSWVSGATTVKQAKVALEDSDGNTVAARHLTDYQNCSLADPDHSYDGGRTHYNGGEMDGFLLTQPVGDDFPVGYYTADDLPFYKGVVANWTLCDHYFPERRGRRRSRRRHLHRSVLHRRRQWHRALVREQSFARGRNPLPAPAANVQRRVDGAETGLREADGRVWQDGR
ncbi:MAG: alkaline phosphatase family protein, partial [Solimonas sp.]